MEKPSYPCYFKTKTALLAFISSSEMYKIAQVGSNGGNQGVCIDHYTTRKMVLKHYPGYGAEELRSWQFRDLVRKLFEAYTQKIIMYGDH